MRGKLVNLATVEISEFSRINCLTVHQVEVKFFIEGNAANKGPPDGIGWASSSSSRSISWGLSTLGIPGHRRRSNEREWLRPWQVVSSFAAHPILSDAWRVPPMNNKCIEKHIIQKSRLSATFNSLLSNWLYHAIPCSNGCEFFWLTCVSHISEVRTLIDITFRAAL